MKDKEYKVNLIKPVTLDVNQAPIKVDASLDVTTLEIRFSDEIKDAIHERQTKANSTANSTATATATKENPKRGRQNPEKVYPTTKEMR